MTIFKKNKWTASAFLLLAFILWTVAIKQIDIQAIGPNSSEVGFATLNQFIHNLTGVHFALYTLTDLLSVIPIGFVLYFAAVGLYQLVTRKSILKVDQSILTLGFFYVLVIGTFLFFELIVINYRPVLIEGVLEASYPSSTTMLVLCVMPTAWMQLKQRIHTPSLNHATHFILNVFTAFMVIARLISGVHWFTDIVGGMLISATLVFAYKAIANQK